MDKDMRREGSPRGAPSAGDGARETAGGEIAGQPAGAPTGSDRRRRTALHAALIAITVLATFAPVVGYGFLSGDAEFVRGVPRRCGTDCKQGVRERIGAENGPLAKLWLAAQYEMFDFFPRGYRVSGVILHAINAALLFGLCRLIGFGAIPSAAGALLWALHPLRAQAAAEVASQGELLGGLLCLTCGLLYFRLREHLRTFCGASIEPAFTTVTYWLSITAFILSMFVRSALFILPVLLILADSFLDAFPLGVRHDEIAPPRLAERLRITLQVALRKTLLALPMLFAGLYAAWAIAAAPIAGGAESRAPETALKTCCISARFLVMTAFPAPLCVLRPVPAPVSLTTAPYAMSVALLAALMILAVVAFMRAPWVCCALLFSLFGLLCRAFASAAGGWPTKDDIAYLPSIGLCLLGGYAAFWAANKIAGGLDKRRLAAAALALLAALPFAFITRQRLGVWSGSVAYWSDALRCNENDPSAMAALAEALMLDGRLQEGIALLTKAADSDSPGAGVLLNLALGLSLASRHNEASKAISGAALLCAAEAGGKAARGTLTAALWESIGAYHQAAALYESLKADLQDQNEADAAILKAADAYRRAGVHAHALRLLSPLLDRAPTDPAALLLAWRASLDAGDFESAEGYLKRYTEGGGSAAEAAACRAEAALRRGEITEGIRIARQAMKDGVTSQRLDVVLAKLLLESAQSCQIRHTRYELLAEAESLLRRALAEEPDDWERALALARVLFERQKAEKALRILEMCGKTVLIEPEAAYHFARILKSLGDERRSQFYLEISVRRAPPNAYWKEDARHRLSIARPRLE